MHRNSGWRRALLARRRRLMLAVLTVDRPAAVVEERAPVEPGERSGAPERTRVGERQSEGVSVA